MIIDDGGHHVKDQLTAFAEMFKSALRPGGVYAIEDIETSYWKVGTPLYGTPHAGPSGCRGSNRAGVGRGYGGLSTVDAFLQAVHAPINAKFTDSAAVVTGPADQWIKSITFSQNLIIMTKKDESDCSLLGPYVWPDHLAPSCPASRSRSPPDPATNHFWRWCKEQGWVFRTGKIVPVKVLFKARRRRRVDARGSTEVAV